MINRVLTYLFIIIISTVCAQCEPACSDAASTDRSDQFIKFTQDIRAIDEEGNFTLSFAFLLGSAKFRNLWEDLRDNVDSCIRYISEPDHTYQQREIALHSMSKLDVEHYVDFAQKLSELLGKHLINYYEFYSAIIPTYEFSPTAVENYKNPHIRDVLDESEVVQRSMRRAKRASTIFCLVRPTKAYLNFERFHVSRNQRIERSHSRLQGFLNWLTPQ